MSDIDFTNRVFADGRETIGSTTDAQVLCDQFAGQVTSEQKEYDDAIATMSSNKDMATYLLLGRASAIAAILLAPEHRAHFDALVAKRLDKPSASEFHNVVRCLYGSYDKDRNWVSDKSAYKYGYALRYLAKRGIQQDSVAATILEYADKRYGKKLTGIITEDQADHRVVDPNALAPNELLAELFDVTPVAQVEVKGVKPMIPTTQRFVAVWGEMDGDTLRIRGVWDKAKEKDVRAAALKEALRIHDEALASHPAEQVDAQAVAA